MTLTAERACNSANILSETTELQGLARANSQSPTAAESRISFHVVHVLGAVYAWRLIEAEGPAEGRKYRRRMLCFASTTQLRDALEAIAAWMRADREFCATHAIIHAGFHAVTTDWVHPGLRRRVWPLTAAASQGILGRRFPPLLKIDNVSSSSSRMSLRPAIRAFICSERLAPHYHPP